MRKILITGGSGFIGSNLIRMWQLEYPEDKILNVDAFLGDSKGSDYVGVDLRFRSALASIVEDFMPDGVLHLAAMTPACSLAPYEDNYFTNNVNGTYNLLAACTSTWEKRKKAGRLLNVSTTDAFCDLGDLKLGLVLDEAAAFRPASPYGVSKAAADQLISLYASAHGLNAVTVYASQVFGPKQSEWSFIPTAIASALKGGGLLRSFPIDKIDDWLYVDDFCWGIMQAFELGRPGESYCFSGGRGRRASEVWRQVIRSTKLIGFDEEHALASGTAIEESRVLVSHGKAMDEWGWYPELPFEIAVDETVRWYIEEGI